VVQCIKESVCFDILLNKKRIEELDYSYIYTEQANKSTEKQTKKVILEKIKQFKSDNGSELIPSHLIGYIRFQQLKDNELRKCLEVIAERIKNYYCEQDFEYYYTEEFLLKEEDEKKSNKRQE